MALYGLVGKSLKHSFSQKYFTEKFTRENRNDHYMNFELDSIDELDEILIKNIDLKGLSVTIPYKKDIIKRLDYIDDAARKIGAVNAIKIIRQKNRIMLYGYNTDTYGFESSFKPLLENMHKSALILGTGGASKAVAYVLDSLNIKYKFVSRTPNKSLNQIAYSDLNKTIFAKYQIVINTSPVGQFPEIERAPALPYHLVDNTYYFYDLIYNPKQTVFLTKAVNNGAVIKNGLEMLHIQAERAWDIFQLELP